MIDRQTVEKILDTADIVDVVSDYVSLKKRGANWVGLCPFHNDRKPSFYVTRTKGFCKCFSCGEGGSPVNFIMKIENMSYPEALRYLAKKYNIEIEEKELTDEERQQQSEQESMFVINEFAMGFFEKQLHDTQEGVDVGLSYFRERGFSDESIHNFHLGYSPDKPTALHDAAVKAGYNAELLIKVGLCGKDERGRWYDKFRGRVIFPIFTKSGKVVAFGGRTLHNHHAKYINSPESAIYHKRKTIYGLAQAKREIAKLDKCYIVEGYADVISMHQAGFKNVIATSGTALTKEHIYAIRNLTNNVTELFDGDEAGIKAAIKGVDMLLKQDLNIKVLVLPSPEDPDSFAQNHSASEITEYINQNEQDFIDFKTDVLLKDCERDPIARAKAIESVLRSVANIPNQITRNVYAQVCVNKFHMSERVIVTQIDRYRAQIQEEDWKNEERDRKQRELDAKRNAEAATTAVCAAGQDAPLPPPLFDVNIPPASYPQEEYPTQPPVPQPAPSLQQPSAHESALQKCEYEVIQYMVKYGCSFIFEYEQITVIEWLTKEITDDNHRFTIPLYQKLYKLCQELFSDFTVAFNNFMQSVEERKNQLYTQEIEQFRSSFEGNVEEIERKEEEAKQAIDTQFENEISEYRQDFIFKHLSSHPDDDVREIVNEICLPKHSLSKIHAEMFSQHMDSQRLLALVSASLFNWKLTIIEIKISQLETELKSATIDRQFEILKEIQELTSYRKELAKLTGERVVNPKNLN